MLRLLLCTTRIAADMCMECREKSSERFCGGLSLAEEGNLSCRGPLLVCDLASYHRMGLQLVVVNLAVEPVTLRCCAHFQSCLPQVLMRNKMLHVRINYHGGCIRASPRFVPLG